MLVAPGGDTRVPSLSLERRAAATMAHARLYAELRSIALDLLGPCEPGELPGAMASWVEHAATLATSAVCDESLQALIRVLDATVAGAPPDVLRRLEDAAARHGVGFD